MEQQIQTIKNWLGSGSLNLFGRPFSGKDTQGRRLADALGAPLIGGGDILRSHPDADKVAAVMASGALIPSDSYFELVLPYLAQPQFTGKPLVLDAVGRSSGEETMVLDAATKADHPLKAVVVLDISEDEVWQRFDAAQAQGDRGHRSDDTRQVVQNRLRKYQEKTVPVIEFYRQKGLLVTVNGAQTRDQVFADMLHSLAGFAASPTE